MQLNHSIQPVPVGDAIKPGDLICKTATALLITFAAFLLLVMADLQLGSPLTAVELLLAQ